MDLGELRSWYGRLRTELDESPFDVTWQGPIAGRPKQSACLSLEGPARLGALTLWDSGEAQLQFADVASGEVSDEALELADAGQLAQSVARMKTWVTVGP